ncbi:MAG: glycosyltransferase family protein [Desulfuromonadales bacterium]
MSEVIQRGEILEWTEEVGKADILVGIPSFNNARTIGHVVRAVQAGLAKYFPECRAVLINSDGGSSDGTMEVVRNTVVDNFDSLLLHHRVRPLAKLATPYHGLPGKGSAFRTFFEIAAALEVKACAVVDSDLRSITPEWIELLIKPVLSDQFDYVAPLYRRHKYDGTITNSIIYPLTRALYGKRVRQPIGGDFGFSGELARLYRSKDVWESDVARFGIDIWMTTTAIANNYRVCQSYLGAKIHDPKDPGADLSAMLFQVVGATFDLMETYAESWQAIRGSEPVPSFGFQYAVGLEPVNVNIERMLQNFRLGVQELADLWREILPGAIITELERASELSADRFHIPEELWVEVIQRFAVVAHRKVMNREHLIKSLTPLYIGRTASFVLETRESDADAVEEKIEALCQIFEAKKSHLVECWA